MPRLVRPLVTARLLRLRDALAAALDGAPPPLRLHLLALLAQVAAQLARAPGGPR